MPRLKARTFGCLKKIGKECITFQLNSVQKVAHIVGKCTYFKQCWVKSNALHHPIFVYAYDAEQFLDSYYLFY